MVLETSLTVQAVSNSLAFQEKMANQPRPTKGIDSVTLVKNRTNNSFLATGTTKTSTMLGCGEIVRDAVSELELVI